MKTMLKNFGLVEPFIVNERVCTNDVNAPVFVSVLSYTFITTCIDMCS